MLQLRQSVELVKTKMADFKVISSSVQNSIIFLSCT